MVMIAINLFQGIEGYRIIQIRRVEVDYFIGSPFRNEVEKMVSQIPVGIDDGQAVSGSDIRDDHILDQGGLACPCLADDVHVAPSVSLFDPEPPPDIPVVGDGKRGDRIFVIFWVEHGNA